MEATVTAAMRDNRNAVRDSATARGIAFVDPLEEGWFRDGITGLIGLDGVHPNDAGHAYLAEKLAPHIQSLLPTG